MGAWIFSVNIPLLGRLEFALKFAQSHFTSFFHGSDSTWRIKIEGRQAANSTPMAPIQFDPRLLAPQPNVHQIPVVATCLDNTRLKDPSAAIRQLQLGYSPQMGV